jgi:site-specific recombinase XerD
MNIDVLLLENLTYEKICDFLKWIEAERGNAKSTRNLRLAVLRSFFRYVQGRLPAALEQCSRIRGMKAKKVDIPVVDWLTLEETVAVLRAPGQESAEAMLDRAMLLLAYACGLRVSEATSLSLDDLDLGPRPSVHILGKGRRARVLPLAPNTVRHLRAWIALRPTTSSDNLFVNGHGLPITRDAFALRLKKYVRLASTGIPNLRRKNVTPHVLRHSCAMHMLKGTKDIRKVSLWLGHASLKTTEIYLHADPDEKLEILTARGDLGIKAGRFSPQASAMMVMLRTARDGNDGLAAVPSPRGSSARSRRGSR